MGSRTVLVKKGFFGLKRPEVEHFCDGCGHLFQPTQRLVHGHAGEWFCHPCARTRVPDDSHVWSGPKLFAEYPGNHTFFTDTRTGEELCIEQCCDCLTLLSVKKTAAGFERRFFRIGSPDMSKSAPPCEPHGGYDDEGDVRIQKSCLHHFVAVGTSKDLSDAAHKKFRHLSSHRNKEMEAMFGIDDIDQYYFAFGSTRFWCWKCGLHYNLNPQREHLLPKVGLAAKG